MAQGYESTTDTHLAKKYNDALFDCMMRCNMTGYVARTEVHIESLIAYHSAVEMFYNNTFFLFESVVVEISKNNEKSLSLLLIELNNEIEEAIKNMKAYQRYRTPAIFHNAQTRVSYMHKMIMYGLQQRQMLVRMSEREPTGKDSIKYWNEKVGFKKGNIISDQDKKEG